MDRPAAEEMQPPLTWWRQTWRIALTLAISAVVWPTYAFAQWERARPLFWLDLGLGVACFALMFLRRRWPVPVALITNALSAVSTAAAGPATLCAVSLATRRRWLPILGTVGVSLLATLVYARVEPTDQPESPWLSLGVAAIVLAGSMGWGMYIGSRRELIWTLRQRAERAEAEQERRVAQARSNERNRIAREMHDVLAHRISQISLHAGALSFRDDLSAGEMRASAGVIREKAHEALTDLRGVLGVLRDPAGELLAGPQPAYVDLPALVDEAREVGLRVDFDDHLGPSAPVPDAVGRTVYRIVQEGITNVRKHAPGAALSIDISGSPDEGIDVVLCNPLGFGRTQTPASGLGLIGLSERAELRGGRLSHRDDGRVFVVHGWIPWAA